MKHFFTLLLPVFILANLFTSCNEKINLIGDFTETAVVYGLLDKSDSIHFIKINRAFIGPGNSLEIAQIPDSNYFNQVDATVTEFINGSEVREWELKDSTIENKETGGVFYAPTQKVYYFKTKTCKADGTQQLNSPLPSDLLNSLNGLAKYKLKISVNGGEFEVYGETEIVGAVSTSAELQNFRFDFIENTGEYAQSGISTTIGNPVLGKCYIVNTSLEVNFEEIIQSTLEVNTKTFKWNLGESEIEPGSSKSFTMNGQTFYDLIKSNVTANPLITKRRMKSIKVISIGGSQDLSNYMAVNKPSSSLAQNKPTFTNLTATGDHRVIGIFSSRYTRTTEKLYINPSNTSLRIMTVETVVELCKGAITGLLLFCSQHPADLGTNYACP
jgi:hypothetical protein